MKTYNIAAIPGDGIGTEVIAAGIQVLESLARRDGGFALRFEHFDCRSHYYLKNGEMMLPHLGELNAAARLIGAIEYVTSARVFTPDLGGSATTAQVTGALCKAIEASPGHA
jgi:isocitrate/isopropylmalate dehydrogenase